MYVPILAGRGGVEELIFQKVLCNGDKTSRHTGCGLIWQISRNGFAHTRNATHSIKARRLPPLSGPSGRETRGEGLI